MQSKKKYLVACSFKLVVKEKCHIDYKYYNLTKLFNIRSFTFVHSSEMEAHSARQYTNICRSAISELSLIKHTEINFESILSITNVKEMPNLQTHTQHTLIRVHLGL